MTPFTEVITAQYHWILIYKHKRSSIELLFFYAKSLLCITMKVTPKDLEMRPCTHILKVQKMS